MREDPLAALADIEILAPPEAGAALLPALAAILVLVGVAAWLIARRHREPLSRTHEPTSSPEEALQRLATLRANWQAGTADDRETGYRLCALLRIGLGLPALDPATPPHALPRREAWAPLLHGLQRLRYARGGAHLSEEAFDLAMLWLAAAQTRNPAESARDV